MRARARDPKPETIQEQRTGVREPRGQNHRLRGRARAREAVPETETELQTRDRDRV